MKGFEIPQPKHSAEQHIDAELHEQLTNIHQLSAYQYFNGSREYTLINTPIDDEKEFVGGVREKTKQEFFSNPHINPILSYPALKKFNATEIESEFIQFKNSF